MWNDLPYTALTPERWMGSRMQSPINWLLTVDVFSSVLRGASVCGVAKAIYKHPSSPLVPVMVVLIIVIITLSYRCFSIELI